MKLSIPDFSQASVLIVGDVMLDRYWFGKTSRISPEAPVPVVHVGEAEERPGGAANVAVNIATLGARVTQLGLVGDDEAAQVLTRELDAAGVSCRFTTIASRPTITKLRVLSRNQQLIRLDFEDGFHGCDDAALLQAFEQALPQHDVVVLSDYGKGSLDQVADFIRLACAAGKPVLVDPKGADFDRYYGSTLLTPNLSEFEAVAGGWHNEEQFIDKALALRERLGLDALLVTRSEQGMTLLLADGEVLNLSTRAQEVYDVTGAGDSVIALLAAGLAAEQTLAEATAMSNLGAGVVVGKLGTAAVSVPELQRAIHNENRTGTGVMSEQELLDIVSVSRAHDEKIIMTNGCFDILHAGHVHYLQQAARLGDRLIVAVNDDASVKRLKGEERPVNTLERRMAVLAALGCVDWVVPFSEDTPERLICAVKPHVLVKGGDNDPDSIPGGACVRDNGGEVQVLDFVDNCSTTGLIDSIRTRDQDD
jgi:D-beta-D-heptose 7-phosphate kinase/D-beta-D-heptose 1-phosphate adenosyltransferase